MNTVPSRIAGVPFGEIVEMMDAERRSRLRDLQDIEIILVEGRIPAERRRFIKLLLSCRFDSARRSWTWIQYWQARLNQIRRQIANLLEDSLRKPRNETDTVYSG